MPSVPAERGVGVARLVAAHLPGDEREALSKEIILVELARLDRPFDEYGDPTHLTASAVIVGRRGVILHRHRRLHRWMQPGGHIEKGESPEVAAVRECAEETGLVVAHPPGGPRLIHLDVHRSAGGHVHLDLRFLVSAPDQAPAPGPGESQEVAWFGWDEALALADESLVGALSSARRLIETGGDRTAGRG